MHCCICGHFFVAIVNAHQDKYAYSSPSVPSGPDQTYTKVARRSRVLRIELTVAARHAHYWHHLLFLFVPPNWCLCMMVRPTHSARSVCIIVIRVGYVFFNCSSPRPHIRHMYKYRYRFDFSYHFSIHFHSIHFFFVALRLASSLFASVVI